MRNLRAYSLLLVLVASPARAQAPAVDFDGLSSGVHIALPSLAKPPVLPAAPSAPSGTVTFNGVSLPARAFSRVDRIPVSLAAAIDATRSTLRLALYELNLPGVTDAIVRAKARGVDVKLIYDRSHGSSAAAQSSQVGTLSGPSAQFRQLVDAGVETRLLRGGGAYGIMHNKIAVFDGELVETGSFNWSVAADQSNFENALFRDDRSLASLYTAYWDWMWPFGGPVDSAAPQPADGFGAPPSDPAPSLSFKGTAWPRVDFSPAGGTEARLVEAISRCTRSVDIAIFSFYSQALADAVSAAKDRGVAVRVVADVSQSRKSPAIASLISRGVDILLSSGRSGHGVLHHKFLILDGELVSTGSYNFSQNAEKDNFENQFYTTDPGDLAAWATEFQAVWAQSRPPAPADAPSPLFSSR